MASRPLPSDPAAIVALLSGPGRSDLASFLIRQRWFAAKTRAIRALAVVDWAPLDTEPALLLVLLDVDGDRYNVPVAVSSGAAVGSAIARTGAAAVVDAHDDPRLGRRLLAAIAANRRLAGHAGRFCFEPTPGWSFPADPDAEPIRRLSGEQSNTSLVVGDRLVLKSLRRPRPGVNPDLEVTRFLTTRTAFRHVPRLAGWIEYEGASGPATLGLLQEFVDNRGDGWSHVLAALAARAGARGLGPEAGPDPLVEDLRRLGAITGGLHAALASDASDPDFAPAPIGRADVARWAGDITRDLAGDDVRRLLAGDAGPGVDVPAGVARALAGLEALVGTAKIRCHGDYHLGQVLKTADGFAIIDFEGEPARPLEERRLRQSPLRDVAGMLRSLDYAAHAVAFRRPETERPAALDALTAWEAVARRAFVDGYRDVVARSPVPLAPASEEAFTRACAAFELEKACYELRYEMNNRPDWAAIPLAGIARVLLRPARG
jgi:trehalose synthase-fused probable maltokinase